MKLITAFLILFSNLSLAQITTQETYRRGQMIYNEFCVRCHRPDGGGIKGIFPPLAKADYLKNIKETIRSIAFGLKGPIVVNGVNYDNSMAPMGLDDQEVADVTNYILNSWGNKHDEEITIKDVQMLNSDKP